MVTIGNPGWLHRCETMSDSGSSGMPPGLTSCVCDSSCTRVGGAVAHWFGCGLGERTVWSMMEGDAGSSAMDKCEAMMPLRSRKEGDLTFSSLVQHLLMESFSNTRMPSEA